MTKPQVFIPSRGRWDGARKLTDAWFKEGFDVNWVVEPSEWATYANRVEDAKVYPLPMKDGGIAYSRNHCVNLAASFGHQSIILADDDIKPYYKGGNMDILVKNAEHPKVLGITARYSYHDLCLGPDIKGCDDLILLSTGTFRLVALNVKNVLDLGNYDIKLDYAEDCDLFLRGLKAGYPWMVHLGTYSSSIGTRYEPGGMLDFAGGKDNLAEHKGWWHEDIQEKYPDLINEHTEKCRGKQNCISIQWKRAYNKYMPDWKKYSALHGGNIGAYLDA